MRNVGKKAIVIFPDTITYRLPEVMQKSVGDILAFNDPARHNGKVLIKRIASELFKFFRKTVCPVYSAHFPTVSLEIFDAVSYSLRRVDERLDHGLSEYFKCIG